MLETTPSGVREVVLLLADISGYTQYVTANRTALEHSQVLIGELLGAVIAEARVPLDVAKVEGDAVFLYAVKSGPEWEQTLGRVRGRLGAFFEAFRQRLSELRETITCNCSMCAHVDQLRLKLIVHTGEALFTRVGGYRELLGVDVVAAHKLLKNGVPETEYLLATEEAAAELRLPEGVGRPLTEHYDGLGDVRARVFLPETFRDWGPSRSGERREPEPPEREMARLSRRGLLWSAVSVASVFALDRWLVSRSPDNGIPWPFRRVLEINERLSRDLFSSARLAPTFPRSLAREPRPNGEEGLGDDFDPRAWKLRVEGLWGRDEPLELSLAEIQRLPRVEMVTELKCVEGWSEVVHWAGVRLADFAARYPPLTRSGEPPEVRRRPGDLAEYVALETPDGGYYVGLDLESALHPQTLLCYEMNGAPLTPEHGAPLRLVIPVKYGIKNLKRIGTLRFTNERPADYWAERGYDWYAGH